MLGPVLHQDMALRVEGEFGHGTVWMRILKIAAVECLNKLDKQVVARDSGSSEP